MIGSLLIALSLLNPTGVEAQPYCPVAAEVDFGNMWGAPRPGGRRHRGVDVFAVRNAPIVAPEAGVVEFGDNKRGGRSLWVQADSGNRYYMTHLEGWATPLVSSGDRVKAGWVIGYVGNDGNAAGTSPHVHIEVRRDGRRVNPYSWLADVCRSYEPPTPVFYPAPTDKMEPT